MKRSLGLSLALLVAVAGVSVLIWGYVRFDRSAVIPLIDRNDTAYAEALFHLDRRALNVVLGKSNVPLERARGNQLQLARELARARLSQTAYEARLARVERGADRRVIIAVPPYRWAGAKLERYVLQDLLHGTADPALRHRIALFFYHYGTADQSLAVSADIEQVEGTSMTIYTITHRFSGWWVIPMTLGSRLPASHLVSYAPFLRLFPVP